MERYWPRADLGNDDSVQWIGKNFSNELNSSHNTLYFVDCPQSRGTVL